jgi:hypothetical protein
MEKRDQKMKVWKIEGDGMPKNTMQRRQTIG